MLSKEKMDSLAAMLGIKADVLAKAISDEQEVELELPKGRFLTEEQESKILDNHGKRKYDEGISKATKYAFDGKNKDDFIKEFVDAALEEAKVEPNTKIKDLQDSLKNLQSQLLEKDTKYSQLESSVKVEKTKFKVQSLIPDLPEGLGLNKDEAASLFFMGIEQKEDGIYKNGKLLKDNMENALSLEDAVKSFVTEKGWDKAPSGRGGGAGGGAGKKVANTPKTMEEYENLLKEKGINVGSAEANAILREAAKETPEILG